MKLVNPYHPPTSPSSVRHVALASKTFRVFGLADQAWRIAREDRKKVRLGVGGLASSNDDDEKNGDDVPKQQGGGVLKPGMMNMLPTIKGSVLTCDDDSFSASSAETVESAEDEVDADAEKEEEEDLDAIHEAILTALAEDAGGYGTAGFHSSRASCGRLLSNLNHIDNSAAAIFGANLVPHDADSDAPVDPLSVVSINQQTGVVNYSGNDEAYLTPREDGEVPQFQLRVNVCRAAEGMAANAFYAALFAKRRTNNGEPFDVDAWVEEDEELRALHQRLIDARDHRGEETATGYYVEFMLVDPTVPEDELVVAPPSDLDRTAPISRSLSASTKRQSDCSVKGLEDSDDEDSPSKATTQSIFAGDIYALEQFKVSGPWEGANIKAYTDLALDMRKALVRVEFPVFPEGCKERTFREVYQLNARLKSGSFATVCRGTHRATGKKIAVKCVLRKNLPPGDDAAVYDEVLILSTLRHSYICPLIDFFEERECYFLVMELMSGGDLFDRIGKRKSYTENDARSLCRKMLESLRYCHENSVAHCDMKPKNLLLMSDDDDVMMKLADFGFATRVYSPKSLTKQCGTPFFVAPEVLMRSPYDQQSDMWSCGVIMFLLLGGDLPFMGRSQKELFRNIVTGGYEFEEGGWAHVSQEAKDLVTKLLVTDPSERLTSREAMGSPWMRSRGQALAMNNLQHTSQRLRGFNARMKLRASMITVRSTVSMRMSLGALRKASAAPMKRAESRPPSFLGNLPMEGGSDDEDSD